MAVQEERETVNKSYQVDQQHHFVLTYSTDYWLFQLCTQQCQQMTILQQVN